MIDKFDLGHMVWTRIKSSKTLHLVLCKEIAKHVQYYKWYDLTCDQIISIKDDRKIISIYNPSNSFHQWLINYE